MQVSSYTYAYLAYQWFLIKAFALRLLDYFLNLEPWSGLILYPLTRPWRNLLHCVSIEF